MEMLKYFKTLSTIIMLAMTVGATTAAFAATSPFPQGGDDWYLMFWSMPRMKAMDKNKDGMVSRQEYMDYMMAQYDKMDQNKDKMLSDKEFTNKKMMMSTFPVQGTPE